MQLSKRSRKRRVEISHAETVSEGKSQVTVTLGASCRREPSGLSPCLCIWVVASEWVERCRRSSLPQGASRDWHIFTFRNVSSGKAPFKRAAHACGSRSGDPEPADEAARRCFMPHDASGLPQSKTENKNIQKIWQHSRILLFEGRTQENNLLRVLMDIPWHSPGLGDSLFYHKGSRRTSASERILAELGTFHGPGLRGPSWLCRASGIQLIEATMPRLLLISLE